MNKVDKYIKRFTSDVIVSSRSRYYRFGHQILRVSDHIGSASSGNYSIIILPEGYIFHTHSTGAVKIISYEDIKCLVRSINLCSDIISQTATAPTWELSKKETLVIRPVGAKKSEPIISNELLIKNTKMLYSMLSTAKKKTVKSYLSHNFSNKDSDFLAMGINPQICAVFTKTLGINSETL